MHAWLKRDMLMNCHCVYWYPLHIGVNFGLITPRVWGGGYRKSENFRCKDIFVVDIDYEN